MTTRDADSVRVDRLREVGRYALGIDWGDGHESILPHRTIRDRCPCDACGVTSAETPRPSGAEPPVDVQVLGGRSVFIRWADGHETLMLVGELRDLCRCARCVGEPDYPISGR